MRSRGQAYHVIVVDDGSSDQTARVAAGLARNLPVSVMTHVKKEGMGRALRTGLLEAARHGGVIVTLDAQQAHNPLLIPRMLDRLHQGYDIVIASRYDDGGLELGGGVSRRLIRKTTNAAVRALTPLRDVRDHTSGFRAYRGDLLQTLAGKHGKEFLVHETGFASRLELLLKATSTGARILEIPQVSGEELRHDPPRRPILATLRRYAAVVWRHRVAAHDDSQPEHDEIVFPGARSVRNSERLHRALSVAVALIGIAATAPLMALIALAVKLTSRGPVLYMQTRVGIDRRTGATSSSSNRRQADNGGRPFRIYKFRTMDHVPENSNHQVWARPNDPRVTTVGRFLRQTRMDELPQLFNVLRGDMNIVGPRPEQPKIFADLRSKIGRYEERQRVPPGITGRAQVLSSYDQTLDDVRRKVAFDLEYVERRSVWEDLRIMFQTIPVVVLRRGAW